MSKSGLRLQKSRSMMLSLYSLSGLATLLIVLFVATLWMRTLAFLGGVSFIGLSPFMHRSLMVHGVAVILAVPFAVVLTYLATLWWSTRWSHYFHWILKTIDQSPPLIYGMFFLVLVGGNTGALILTFWLLAVVMITRRWLTVVEKIPLVQIESAQAMGMNLPQITYLLYIKPHFVLFVTHLLAVYCSLFMLVVPVLCFSSSFSQRGSVLSLELFSQILEESPNASGLALILLLIHAFRAFLDQRTSFWEVEYG